MIPDIYILALCQISAMAGWVRARLATSEKIQIVRYKAAILAVGYTTVVSAIVGYLPGFNHPIIVLTLMHHLYVSPRWLAVREDSVKSVMVSNASTIFLILLTLVFSDLSFNEALPGLGFCLALLWGVSSFGGVMGGLEWCKGFISR